MNLAEGGGPALAAAAPGAAAPAAAPGADPLKETIERLEHPGIGLETNTFYGSKEFINKCIEQLKVENSKKDRKMWSGNYGYVFKIIVDDRPYFIKTILRNHPNAPPKKGAVALPPRSEKEKKVDEQKFQQMVELIKNEMLISKLLTISIPDAVSILHAAYLNETPFFTKLFLVYEAPPGMNLEEYLVLFKKDPKAKENQEHIFSEIFCSLQRVQRRLNEAGFVHRDIKPPNVYVIIEEGAPLRCKLIDFGFTVPIGYTGLQLGTLAFMPNDMKSNRHRPKGVSAYTGPATPRHNEYSLSVIWSKSLGMSGNPPDCLNESKTGKKGGVRKRRTVKRSKRKTRSKK